MAELPTSTDSVLTNPTNPYLLNPYEDNPYMEIGVPDKIKEEQAREEVEQETDYNPYIEETSTPELTPAPLPVDPADDPNENPYLELKSIKSLDQVDVSSMSKEDALFFAAELGIKDTYRGVKQILGIDVEDERRRQAKLNALMQNPEWGWQVAATYFGSALLDPVGWLLPFKKGLTLAQMAKFGLTSGLIGGALGYRDEQAESLIFKGTPMSRLEQAGLGAIGGGIVAPTAGAARNIYRMFKGIPTTPLTSKGLPSILEKNIEVKKSALDTATKTQTKLQKQLDNARKKGKPASERRKLGAKLTNAKKAVKKAQTEHDDALAATTTTPEMEKGLREPGVSYREDIPVTMTDNIREKYIKWSKDSPFGLHSIVFNNPGGFVTGGMSSVAAVNAAPDDLTMQEKMAIGALAFGAGFAGAKGISKIKINDDISETVGDYFGRGFIDKYGLDPKYVKLKEEVRNFEGHIAARWLEVGKKSAKLSAGDRKLMYRFMTGTSTGPLTTDLHNLSKESRELITETAQAMIDVGLLRKETFERNINTYLHRSYTSKVGGAQNKTQVGLQKARANLSLIGHELRSRGLEKKVRNTPENLKRYTDQGFYVTPGQKTDTKKIKIRRDWTFEERQAMGEIEDAAYAIHETGRLMTTDLATYKFYNDLAESGFASAKPGNDRWVEVPTENLQGTKIRKYGKLAGKYVPPEVWRDIQFQDKFKTFKNLPGIKAYRQINSTWKLSKTAWNPVVHVNNIMSNFVLYDLSDSDWKHMPGALHELYNHLVKKVDSPVVKQAVNLGVFDSDFATNELKNFVKSWAQKNFTVEDFEKTPLKTAAGHVQNLLQKTYDQTLGRMTNAYINEDRIFRLSVFMDRIEKGMSPEEAAADARRWFIDYKIDAPAINFLRETATPFLAYSYRVLPLLAETATTRPWKFAKWAAIGYAMNQLGELAVPEGTPEAERQYMLEGDEGHILDVPFMYPKNVRLPFDIEGKPQYIDVERWFPGGDVMETSGSSIEIPLLPAPLQPSFGAAGIGLQSIFGYDLFTDKQIPGIGADPLKSIEKRLEFAYEKLLPNAPWIPGSYSQKRIARNWPEDWPSMHDQDEYWQRNPTTLEEKVPVWQALLHTFGIKIKPADLRKMRIKKRMEMGSKLEQYADLMRELSKKYAHREITKKEYDDKIAEYYEDIKKIKDIYTKKFRKAEKAIREDKEN